MSSPYMFIYLYYEDLREQDDECLKAEKLLKALLAIDTDEKKASDNSGADAGQDLVIAVSDHSVVSESATANVGSHSNQSADFPTLAEAAKIKRRRKRTRRPRRRKGKLISLKDTHFLSVRRSKLLSPIVFFIINILEIETTMCPIKRATL